MEGLNFHLMEADEPLRVLACEEVDEAFNARFSAKGRAYLYRIINRRAPLALEVGRAWHVPWELDVEAMRAGARHLIGHHDFTSFRASECQANSPMRTLDRLDIERTGEEIRFIIEAQSFLHNQVRIMIGTLEAIGAGKLSPDDMALILKATDRTQAGQTAPACGLYLTRVEY